MRTGIAQLPLDTGKCPRWLFERMGRLLRGITIAVIEEFGNEKFLKRLSDPIWFQSLSAVSSMDWNSSGTTTITLGALKSGIFDIQNELGVYICGGKKVSRKTPEEIERHGEVLGLSQRKTNNLIYASKMTAKVDSSLIQNPQAPFQLYHHNFIFTKNGQWAVIQQAMAPIIQKARRYHWLSSNVKDFVEEPHSGIISDAKVKPLNLTAKESSENREISAGLVKEKPKRFLKDFLKILNKSSSLIKQKRWGNFAKMELNDVEFHWHPVVEEKFDLKRLEKTIFFAADQNPHNFEQLLSLKGVGPKTIRALSLVSEIIYGARPSYGDPARYSFAHGGKDGTPYFPRPEELDQTIKILEKGIRKSRVSIREKIAAQKRLTNSFPSL